MRLITIRYLGNSVRSSQGLPIEIGEYLLGICVGNMGTLARSFYRSLHSPLDTGCHQQNLLDVSSDSGRQFFFTAWLLVGG